MELEDFQKIASTLKGTEEDIKWENHLCFCIAGKIYAILSLDVHPVTISFKVREEEFEEISSQEGFRQAPHLARNKWVYCQNANLVKFSDWKQYLTTSYELVKSKLPKKVQQQLQ
ncbi:MAG: MmcQ/YjbR family DNA-binding protein [Chitinophagales bacterium]